MGFFGVCLLIFSENSASHIQAVKINSIFLMYRQMQYNFNLKAIGMMNCYVNLMHFAL